MFSGQGLQFHPLANFGTLNALYTGGRRNDARAGQLMTELLGMASQRAGGWVGVLLHLRRRAAAVGERALAGCGAAGAHARGDAGSGARRRSSRSPRAPSASFERPTPSGVRVNTPDGPHYALYSFAPGLRVVNGFVYSLVGLYDYASLTGDGGAARCSTPATPPRASTCPATTRAPGRCTRAEPPRASPTSATTCSCGTSYAALRPYGRPLLRGGVALHDLPHPAARADPAHAAGAGARPAISFDLSKISRVAMTITRARRDLVYTRAALIRLRPPRLVPGPGLAGHLHRAADGDRHGGQPGRGRRTRRGAAGEAAAAASRLRGSAMGPRTILYTGKGGVGKTSVAGRHGRPLRRRRRRTLVLSTDPAHSLAEALGEAVVGPADGGRRRAVGAAGRPQDELERTGRRCGLAGRMLAERGVTGSPPRS